jgi:hypothetical protein
LIEGEQRRLSIDAARASVGDSPLVSMPGDLVSPDGRAPVVSPSRALALAVARAPREALAPLQGIYSRPSAAEEKRGSP